MGRASRKKWTKRAVAIAKQGADCKYLKTLRKQDKLAAVKARFVV